MQGLGQQRLPAMRRIAPGVSTRVASLPRRPPGSVAPAATPLRPAPRLGHQRCTPNAALHPRLRPPVPRQRTVMARAIGPYNPSSLDQWAAAQRRETLSRAILGAQDWRQLLMLVNRHGDELNDSQAITALQRLPGLLQSAPLDPYEVRQAQALYDWLKARVSEARAREAQRAREAAERALMEQRQELARAQQARRMSPEEQIEAADSQMRAALESGAVPRGPDAGARMAAFLSREVRRAARADAPGAALVAVLRRYAPLTDLGHVALAAELLGEAYARSGARRGSAAELETIAAALFGAARPKVAGASAEAVASMVGAMADLSLYDEELLGDLLGRAASLLPSSFTAESLSWLLHSLAELQLRPSQRWVAAAAERARQLMPAARLEDLERTASALALMRQPPGARWCAAAEARLEQLSSEVDPSDDAAEGSLMAAIKAVALLGGPNAYRWYQTMLQREAAEEAATERERREQEERERQAAAAKQAAAAREQAAAEARARAAAEEEERRRREKLLQQEQLKLAAERERARREAVLRQQQEQARLEEEEARQQQQAKPVQGQRQQQQQQGQQQQPGQHKHHKHHKHHHHKHHGRSATPGLVSVDDLFTSALDSEARGAAGGRGSSSTNGPAAGHRLGALDSADGLTLREVDDGGSGTGAEKQQPGAGGRQRWREDGSGADAGGGGDDQSGGKVQSVEAPLWAAEQRARWRGRPSSARNEPPTAAPASGGGSGKPRDAAAAADALKRLMAEVEEEEAGEAGGGAEGSDAEALKEMEDASAALQSAIDGLDAAMGRASSPQQPPAKASPPRPPLGSSGAAPFVAAAKALRAPSPNRTLLSGCLEAAEQEARELRQVLLQRQLARELGVKASPAGSGASSGSDSEDPYARPARQLLEDLGRARQRAEVEKAGVQAAAVVEVVRAWLPLLDSFDAALAAQQAVEERSGPPSPGEAAVHAAYRALHKQLLELMRSSGVGVLDGAGQANTPFDPNIHEAVMQQPAPPGVEDGTVLSVLRAGYTVGDTLVRPALVVVAA